MTKYLTISEFAKKCKELGTWPHSESVLRGLCNKDRHSGFDRAFIRVGRRVLVDEQVFWEIMESKRGR